MQTSEERINFLLGQLTERTSGLRERMYEFGLKHPDYIKTMIEILSKVCGSAQGSRLRTKADVERKLQQIVSTKNREDLVLQILNEVDYHYGLFESEEPKKPSIEPKKQSKEGIMEEQSPEEYGKRKNIVILKRKVPKQPKEEKKEPKK